MPLTADELLAIQRLVARYNHALDSGNGEAYADTFTDDGVMAAGTLVIEGREALEAYPPVFARGGNSRRHVASNLVIEGDEGKARLEAYMQMFTLSGDRKRHELVASGKYSDELAKVNGEWRFVRRNLVVDS